MTPDTRQMRLLRTEHGGSLGPATTLFEPPTTWEPPRGELPVPSGLVVAIDIEGRDGGLARNVGPGWVYNDGHICGVAAAWEGWSGYVPIRHPDTECRSPEEVLGWAEQLMGRNLPVFHNAGYDLAWLLHEGVTWPERHEDTYAACVMLDENWETYSLEACCERAGVAGKSDAALRNAAEAFGVDPKAGLWRLPARHVGPYAEQDAVATLGLWEWATSQPDWPEVAGAYRTEISLMRCVRDMRERGIRVDVDQAVRTQQRLLQMSQEARAEIARMVGRRVSATDLRSPESLGDILQRAGISCPLTPRTQKPSVRKEWLEKLEHPMGRLIRTARQTTDLSEKFIGTYILGSEHRGRIHAEVHQLRDEDGGTRTFRLSYSQPPLQQMPSRDRVLAPLIRSIMLPEPGEWWCAPDFCFSDDTEILTREGFVLLRDLPEGALCAQVDPVTCRLTWAQPTARQVKDYTGDMVHVHGRQTDLLVTPDHRCLLHHDNRTPHVVRARDYHRHGGGWNQLGAALYEPELPLTADPDTLRLAVAAQADATLRPSASGESALRWQLRKTRKIDRLLALLERMGVRHAHTPAGRQKATIHVAAPDVPSELWRWLSRDKRRLSEDILELSPELRRVVIEELPHWDGSGDSSYFSTIVENVHLVQRLLVTTGRKCTSTFYPTPSGTPFGGASWSRRDRSGIRHTSKNVVPYSGTVYCVSMPLGTVVVRRNGRVSVTGQSQQEPRLAVHFSALCRLHGSDEAVHYYATDPLADFHTMVARLAGIPRDQAKIINLGLMYGMGIDKLAASLGMTVEDASALMGVYHARVPWVKGLTETCSRLASDRGWIRLLDGARCHFDLWAPIRDREERPLRLAEAREQEESRAAHWGRAPRRLVRAGTHKAMNRLVQGSAARQTKLAMLECHRQEIPILVQMHDELGFSTATEALGERVAEIMRSVVRLRVPVKVDVEYGRSWGSAKHSWDRRDEA